MGMNGPSWGRRLGDKKGEEAGADARRRMAESKLPVWLVTRIRKKGEELGRVRAVDAEAALDKAVEHFGLDPGERRRLAATRVGE